MRDSETMRNWWHINIILWKQYYIRHRVWLLLLLVVGLLFRLWGNHGQDEYRGMTVGVYAQDEQGREILSLLLKEEGIFRFQTFDSEEELRRQVENGSLECGYVFPDGFYEELAEGRLRRQIGLYYSPSSSAYRISYEVVFAHLYQMISDQVLENYLEESELGMEQLPQLLKLQEEFENNESTFSFRYETVGEEMQKEKETLDVIRGCIGVMIFFMSLLGLGNCQELTQISSRIPGMKGNKVKNMSLHIALFGSILTGAALILLSGTGENVLREIGGLLVYWVVLEVYVRLLKLLSPTSRSIYGMIPVLLLGSLLFAPVFIRIEAYLPAASLIGKLFPVTWYLECFY